MSRVCDNPSCQMYDYPLPAERARDPYVKVERVSGANFVVNKIMRHLWRSVDGEFILCDNCHNARIQEKLND